MNLDEIYNKIEKEKYKKLEEKEKINKELIDNYNNYIYHINEERKKYEYLFKNENITIGRSFGSGKKDENDEL